MDRQIGLIIALIGVSLILLFLFVGPIAGINTSLGSLDMPALSLRVMGDPKSTVTVAVYGDEEDRELANVLMGGREPHELAVSSDTRLVTSASVKKLQALLDRRDIHPEVFTDVYTKCKGWLLSAEPGASTFEYSDALRAKYYGDLEGGGFATLSGTGVSTYLAEKSGAVDDLCGEAGCPYTQRCTECGVLIGQYREYYQQGDAESAREVENEIMGVGEEAEFPCAQACAEVCGNIYPVLDKIILPQQIGGLAGIDPEVRKEFISTGVTLN